MSRKFEKSGHFELFETSQGHEILKLNQYEYYALISGKKGDLMVLSDANHKKERAIRKGNFLLADFANDAEFQGMPHLFLAKGSDYEELILPNGLPSQTDYQKKLIRVKDRVPQSKVIRHLAEQSPKDHFLLDHLTKDQLSQLAKKQGIRGRSRMTKAQLREQLQN